MISQELLEILVCPENRTRLVLAGAEIVSAVNASIRSGRLTNRAGRSIETEIEAGLVREDGQILYPIVDGIPVLLIDEAIPLYDLPQSGPPPEGQAAG